MMDDKADLWTMATDLCATCAFRSGTEANRSANTRLTVRLCLLSGDPFDCHEKEKGSLCEGFRRAWDAQRDAGKMPPEWKRRIAELSFEALEMVEDGRATQEEAIDWHLRQIRGLDPGREVSGDDDALVVLSR